MNYYVKCDFYLHVTKSYAFKEIIFSMFKYK